MYIVEIYVIIVTYISSRNLVVPIRSSNLVGNFAPRGLTNSASHATLAKLTIRTHNTQQYSTIPHNTQYYLMLMRITKHLIKIK